MQGYIYLIENKINGKRYIGQTARSLDERIVEHQKEANSNGQRPISKAICKYGWGNFDVRIIEECSIDILASREIYWIQYYNTYNGEGYNATMGGEGKILFDEKEIIKIFETVKNINETARIIGCSADSVSLVLRRNNISSLSRGEVTRLTYGKSISAYDLKTNEFIKNFQSQGQAGEWIIAQGKTKMADATSRRLSYFIGRAARGLDNRKQAYGYIWKYD